MQLLLKASNFIEESARIVELCEDWWELLRQENLLWDVQKVFKCPLT